MLQSKYDLSPYSQNGWLNFLIYLALTYFYAGHPIGAAAIMSRSYQELVNYPAWSSRDWCAHAAKKMFDPDLQDFSLAMFASQVQRT